MTDLQTAPELSDRTAAGGRVQALVRAGSIEADVLVLLYLGALSSIEMEPEERRAAARLRAKGLAAYEHTRGDLNPDEPQCWMLTPAGEIEAQRVHDEP